MAELVRALVCRKTLPEQRWVRVCKFRFCRLRLISLFCPACNDKKPSPGCKCDHGGKKLLACPLHEGVRTPAWVQRYRRGSAETYEEGLLDESSKWLGWVSQRQRDVLRVGACASALPARHGTAARTLCERASLAIPSLRAAFLCLSVSSPVLFPWGEEWWCLCRSQEHCQAFPVAERGCRG